jgi:hypothetical protein
MTFQSGARLVFRQSQRWFGGRRPVATKDKKLNGSRRFGERHELISEDLPTMTKNHLIGPEGAFRTTVLNGGGLRGAKLGHEAPVHEDAVAHVHTEYGSVLIGTDRGRDGSSDTAQYESQKQGGLPKASKSAGSIK